MREIYTFLIVVWARLAICLVVIYFHPDHISNEFHPTAKIPKFFFPVTRGPKRDWLAKKANYLVFLPFFGHFCSIFQFEIFLKAWNCCIFVRSQHPYLFGPGLTIPTTPGLQNYREMLDFDEFCLLWANLNHWIVGILWSGTYTSVGKLPHMLPQKFVINSSHLMIFF